MNDIPRRFIVLTTQRTGSTWLMGRIDSVPGAEGHLELFYHDIRREPPRAGTNDYPRFIEIGKRFGHGRRPGAVFGYLDRFYSRPGAIGFKLMYSQVREYPELLAYIALRRLPVIHLVRNNHLDVVLSQELAQLTRTYHATVDEKPREVEAIRLDPHWVKRRVLWLERKRRIMRTALRLLPVPVTEVSYEALCEDREAFLDVCRFIGIRGEEEDRSKLRLSKRQRRPREQAISNYDEIQSVLSSMGYQHLLQ